MNSKRLWITMMIMGAVLMAVAWYSNQKKDVANPAATPAPTASPAAAQPVAAPATGAATAPAASTAAPEAATQPAPARATPITAAEWNSQAAAKESWHAIGSLDAKEFPFQLEITSQGAAIGTLKLSRYYASVEDKQLASKLDGNEAAYEAIRAENPGKYKGHYCLLNPVSLPGGKYLPMATRQLFVSLPSGQQISPRLDNVNWVQLPAPRVAPADANTQTISFSWTLLHDPNFADPGRQVNKENLRPFLTLYKTYSVSRTNYSVQMSLEAVNESNLALKVAIDQGGPAGIPSEDPTNDMRSVMITKRVDNAIKTTAKSFMDAKGIALGVGDAVGHSKDPAGGTTLWIAEINKFFGSVMYLKPAAGRPDTADQNVMYFVAAAEEGPDARVLLTSVTAGVENTAKTAAVPAQNLAPGENWQLSFDVFAGPKKRDMFEEADAPYFQPLYRDQKYINTIDFGACFCTSSWLALGMMWLLEVLSKLSFGNYGVAIILLVVLVRAILHPLTKKSQVMMMKTQKLAPEMAKLKAKYGDDKDTLNKEMMKLYREQGFTPLLGCLPMVLQMPIWIALWGGLNAAVELRHAAFLPVWLTDLAAPDIVYSFASPLPLIGITSLHLLPILVAVSIFFQTKLNPQMTGGVAATPEQAQQQKMMKWMMPIMMLFIFYPMPSGLTLYVMASTFAGVGEQVIIRRQIEKKEAMQKLTVTQVEMPGKAPRGSRPKKPKGPFFTKH